MFALHYVFFIYCLYGKSFERCKHLQISSFKTSPFVLEGFFGQSVQTHLGPQHTPKPTLL